MRERLKSKKTDGTCGTIQDSGFFYVCGRDRSFRPAIVFNLKRIDLTDVDAVLRAIIFVQEEVIEKMFIPGQV